MTALCRTCIIFFLLLLEAQSRSAAATATTSPKVENPELAKKLRITLDVTMKQFEIVSYQFVSSTLVTMVDSLKAMSGDDFMIHLNWYLMPNATVVLTMRTRKHINIAKLALRGELNKTTIESCIEPNLTRMEYVGRPSVYVRYLVHPDSGNNWMDSAKTYASNFANTTTETDIVVVLNAGRTQAVIYTKDADGDRFSNQASAAEEKLATGIVNAVVKKIRQLLESCSCKMVGDGRCYYISPSQDPSFNPLFDFLGVMGPPSCGDKRCVKEWSCVEKNAKNPDRERFCSTDGILTDCENRVLCEEQCKMAPMWMNEPCSGTCDGNPEGMQSVTVEVLRPYACCNESGTVKPVKCRAECPSPDYTALGVTLVVVAILLAAGMGATVVLILKRRPVSTETTSKASAKSIAKVGKSPGAGPIPTPAPAPVPSGQKKPVLTVQKNTTQKSGVTKSKFGGKAGQPMMKAMK